MDAASRRLKKIERFSFETQKKNSRHFSGQPFWKKGLEPKMVTRNKKRLFGSKQNRNSIIQNYFGLPPGRVFASISGWLTAAIKLASRKRANWGEIASIKSWNNNNSNYNNNSNNNNNSRCRFWQKIGNFLLFSKFRCEPALASLLPASSLHEVSPDVKLIHAYSQCFY